MPSMVSVTVQHRGESGSAAGASGSRADYGRVSQFGNPFTFTARRQDAHTGLMYYRYRMYEPASGRFVGRDPLGYHDALSPYQGLMNRPTQFVDPTGEFVWFVAIAFIVVAAAVCTSCDSGSSRSSSSAAISRYGNPLFTIAAGDGALSVVVTSKPGTNPYWAGAGPWTKAAGFKRPSSSTNPASTGKWVVEASVTESESGGPVVRAIQTATGSNKADAVTLEGHGSVRDGILDVYWEGDRASGSNGVRWSFTKRNEPFFKGFADNVLKVGGTLNVFSCSATLVSNNAHVETIRSMARAISRRVCWCSGEGFMNDNGPRCNAVTWPGGAKTEGVWACVR